MNNQKEPNWMVTALLFVGAVVLFVVSSYALPDPDAENLVTYWSTTTTTTTTTTTILR